MQNDIIETLKKYSQDHVVKKLCSDELTKEQKDILLSQLANVDFEMINSTFEEKARGKFSKMPVVTLDKIEANKDLYFEIGAKALKNKKAAAVMLAGGQGTRLGFSRPKGCFDIGITRELSIFQAHIENLKVLSQSVGCPKIPLYVMTSEINNDETVKFFIDHDYFGYGSENVRFYKQKSAACTDFNGKLLFENEYSLVRSPNGNGGWFTSLLASEHGEDFKTQGYEWLGMFSVDNPLHKICDPLFLGALILDGAACGIKAIKKAHPFESVGALCLEDGLPSMIAYSEITDEQRFAKDENGELMYNFGDTANFIFNVPKLISLCRGNGADALPIHRMTKKIPYMDENGKYAQPKEPNGFKYEMIAFDLMTKLGSAMAYEADRQKEFAPIKNLHGEDSVDSARELLLKNGYTL